MCVCVCVCVSERARARPSPQVLPFSHFRHIPISCCIVHKFAYKSDLSPGTTNSLQYNFRRCFGSMLPRDYLNLESENLLQTRNDKMVHA